jgi:hypothetical protein
MKRTHIPKYYRLAPYSPKLTNERLVTLDAMLTDMIENKMTPFDVAKKFGECPDYFRNVIGMQRKRGLVIDIRAAHAERIGSNASNLTYVDNSPPRISDEVVKKIGELARAGMPVRKIAKHLGISTGSAQKYAQRERYRSERADPTEPYGGPHA